MGFIDEVKEKLSMLQESFSAGVDFLKGKLSHFKQLSLGEQISYPAVGLGLLLVLVSVVLFIV